MADISRNTYNETKQYKSVIFQRNKNLLDMELNEAQDIFLGLLKRLTKHAFSTGGAFGDSWKVTATASANKLTVAGDSLYVKEGVMVINPTDYSLTMPAPPASGERVDKVYVQVSDVEVDSIQDANLIEGISVFEETAIRRQQKIEILVAQGTDVPADDATYTRFELAEVTRKAGISIIPSGDIKDTRILVRPYHIGVEPPKDPSLLWVDIS